MLLNNFKHFFILTLFMCGFALHAETSEPVESSKKAAASQKDAPAEVETKTEAKAKVGEIDLEEEKKKMFKFKKELRTRGLLGEGGSEIYENLISLQVQSMAHVMESFKKSQGQEDAAFDMESLDRDSVMEIIINLGARGRPAIISKEASILSPDTVLILQGAQPGSTELSLLLSSALKSKVTKVLVNLTSSWNDIRFFSFLAAYMKVNSVDLHVYGACSVFCSNMLVPSAKKVVIEPYGSISYGFSYVALADDMKNALSVIEERMQETTAQFKENSAEALYELVERFSQDEFLSELDQIDLKDEVVLDLNAYLEEGGFHALEKKEDWLNFFDLLDEDLKKTIQNHFITKAFYFEARSKEAKLRSYFGTFENKFFESSVKVQSQLNYSFFEFVKLAQGLVSSQLYHALFPDVKRKLYNVEEPSKVYIQVLPEASLLRSLGIDVVGENNIDILRSTILDQYKESLLHLNAEKIENCGFFKEKEQAPSYSTESLKGCLSQN